MLARQIFASPKSFLRFTLLIFVLGNAADASDLPPAKKIKIGETFKYGNVFCAKVKDKWIPGRAQKKNMFISLAEDIRVYKLAVKKASRKNRKSLSKKLKALQARAKVEGPICANGPDGNPPIGATPTPTSTPTATPLPDHLSLDPYVGSPTAEAVRYLVEKAGFGLSSKEQGLISIAQSQGMAAAVNEFMRVKPEASSLATRVLDRGDVALGNLSAAVGGTPKQTRDRLTTTGFRQGILDFAINTNNPYRENLRHFFLGLWTAGDNVLTNSSQNNPQIPLWLDYWDLLGQSAMNPMLPDRLVEVGRHAMMLLYLNNDQNLRGNVNENYARELMELFSLGTKRFDAASGQFVENYVEFRGTGNRTEGDIYRIATRLTGWRVSPLVGGDGLMYWRSVYSDADHDATPKVIFEGNPWAFTAQTDEDVVRGIFANHPGAPQYIARQLLQWYLTADPPQELVDGFGKLIKESGFHLDKPMATLLSSKAFYDERYKNKVAKTSFQAAVEMVRVLELMRDDIGSQSQEVGVNIPAVEAQVSKMGYMTTLPPTVFFWPESTWTSSPTLIETANFIGNIIADTAAQNRLTGWGLPSVLPQGEQSATAVLGVVSGKLGVALNQNQIDRFIYYMNSAANGANTPTRQLYDNTLVAHQRSKGLALYLILGMQPAFLLK